MHQMVRYRLWKSDERKLVIARDVIFYKDKFYAKELINENHKQIILENFTNKENEK